jgi:hypothetical protein
MNFVFPPWARVTIMVAIFFAGWWTRASIEARHEVGQLKVVIRQAAKADESVAEKLHTEAKGDAQRAALNHANDEAARHDPTYREYLDRPLPDRAVQFLRDAERIPYGPDGADSGPEAGR